MLKRRIYLGFSLALFCLFGMAAESIYSLRSTLAKQAIHAQTFVPAKALAAELNAEILNARIFFIYFVTIQKPQSLSQGWSRYQNAEIRLQSLRELVGKHEELAGLRAPVERLGTDMETYHAALLATVNLVQNGTHGGAAYDAQIKDWAARGAVVVGDTSEIEELCVAGGRVSTQSIIRTLNTAVTYDLVILIASLLVCGFSVFRVAESMSRPQVAGGLLPSMQL